MATVELTRKETVEVTHLRVDAGVRYWEDGFVNGKQDHDGNLIPLRVGDAWRPTIDLADGTIHEWPEGTTASLHYKVCDAGVYTLVDGDDCEVVQKDGYVPAMLSPGGSGYGDYIIMDIGPDGKIADWRVDLTYFEENAD